MDCLREETVSVPGRSGAQSSVASTRRNSSKRECAGCEGSRVILQALLLTLDKYSSWRVGRVVPMIRSAVRTTLCSLLRSDLVAELNQTVIDVQRTDSDGGVELIRWVKYSSIIVQNKKIVLINKEFVKSRKFLWHFFLFAVLKTYEP